MAKYLPDDSEPISHGFEMSQNIAARWVLVDQDTDKNVELLLWSINEIGISFGVIDVLNPFKCKFQTCRWALANMSIYMYHIGLHYSLLMEK